MESLPGGEERLAVEPFHGRLGIQQRVVPSYRAAFFETLAQACPGGLEVFAGPARPKDAIETVSKLTGAGLCFGVNRIFFSGPLTLVWQQGLIPWLESWEPEALIVEANPRVLSTQHAINWMHKRGRPVIGWGLGAPAQPGWIGRISERSLQKYFQQFAALVTYSQKGADEIRTLGVSPGRIFVAPNAVTPRPRQAAPVRPAGFETTPTVLFVGRLQQRKRIDILLRACAALPKQKQPRLWIVGDGPAREEFEDLARAVYPRTEFFGARHGAELDPIFTRADLFVLPGTGGLAVQQAMSYALPVVVAEADGTQVDLVRPENGWQAPPGDVAALTRILDDALSDPRRLRDMGAASYRIVSEEINLESMVDVFLRALRSVSPQSPQRSQR